MKGLIRNNFYSMEGNIKIAFIMAAVLAFTPLLINNSTLLINNSTLFSVIIAIQIFSFVANTGTSLHADETAKWNKFELTLPIKRSTIIGAKYLSFAILILFGLIMSIITVILFQFSKVTPTINSIIWGYEFGLVLSITAIAIMYPIMLKIGTEKNELIFLLSAFTAIGILFLITLTLSNITNGMNLRHPLVGAVSIVFSLFLFGVSYFISLKIHEHKEF